MTNCFNKIRGKKIKLYGEWSSGKTNFFFLIIHRLLTAKKKKEIIKGKKNRKQKKDKKDTKVITVLKELSIKPGNWTQIVN